MNKKSFSVAARTAIAALAIASAVPAFARGNGNPQGGPQGGSQGGPATLSPPVALGNPGDCQSPSVTFGSPSTTLHAIPANLINKADVTLGGASATDCAALYDVQGAVTGNAKELAFVRSLFVEAEWGTSAEAATLLGPEKSDAAGPTSLYGVDWTVTGGGGSWSLGFSSAAAIDKQFDVLAYWKQGNAAAVFLFEDVLFRTGGSLSGSYQIDVCTNDLTSQSVNCENRTGISHISLFIGDPTAFDPPGGGPPAGGPNGDPPGQVPLPGTLALLGLGLGAAGVSRRLRVR